MGPPLCVGASSIAKAHFATHKEPRLAPESVMRIVIGMTGHDDATPYGESESCLSTKFLNTSQCGDAHLIDSASHYRKLMAENHPDKLMARGVPKEFVAIATEKVAAINGAYGEIAKEGGNLAH
jgi:hypothetical protein